MVGRTRNMAAGIRLLTSVVTAVDTSDMAAQKSPSPAMEFLVDSLKKNPKAAYADLKAKADEKGLKLYPIMYGRAQLTLGIAKAGKGKTKARAAKAAKAASAAKAAPKARAGAGRRGRQPDANSKSGKIR